MGDKPCNKRQTLLSQKPVFPFRSGQPTNFVSAKPAIAVSGDKAIHRIAYKGRDQAKRIKPTPNSTDVPGHFQGRIGAQINLPPDNQNHRVEAIGVEPVRVHELAPEIRLQGGKTKPAGFVTAQNPLNGGVAEVTMPVE